MSHDNLVFVLDETIISILDQCLYSIQDWLGEMTIIFRTKNAITEESPHSFTVTRGCSGGRKLCNSNHCYNLTEHRGVIFAFQRHPSVPQTVDRPKNSTQVTREKKYLFSSSTREWRQRFVKKVLNSTSMLRKVGGSAMTSVVFVTSVISRCPGLTKTLISAL